MKSHHCNKTLNCFKTFHTSLAALLINVAGTVSCYPDNDSVKRITYKIQKSLTEFDEGVRPHGAADTFGVISDDELFLQLVQEAEGQHIRVISSADHQVSNTQRVYEAKNPERRTENPDFNERSCLFAQVRNPGELTRTTNYKRVT